MQKLTLDDVRVWKANVLVEIAQSIQVSGDTGVEDLEDMT